MLPEADAAPMLFATACAVSIGLPPASTMMSPVTRGHMSYLIRSIAVVASLILSPVSLAEDTYSNPTLGFSIRKPGTWHYLSAEQHRENLKRSDFADPKFKELVTRGFRWALKKEPIAIPAPARRGGGPGRGAAPSGPPAAPAAR